MLVCDANYAKIAWMSKVPSVSPLPDDDGAYLTGQLLIAMPSLDDPNFDRSVIYLCAHSDEGAMGLVINRPLREPSFLELLRQLKVETQPAAREIRLCHGGPVDHARGFVLHSSDWLGEGTLQVDDEVALTASLDVLKAFAEGGGPRAGLLALGYANWGPGQLDEELQNNVWLSAAASEDLIFGTDPDTTWRRALASLRVDPTLLSSVAGHA